MTVRYELDLTRGVADNVRAIHDSLLEERSRYEEPDHPGVRQRLVLSGTDYVLLGTRVNAFGVSGLRVLTELWPNLSVAVSGDCDPEEVRARLTEWERNAPNEVFAPLASRLR